MRYMLLLTTAIALAGCSGGQSGSSSSGASGESAAYAPARPAEAPKADQPGQLEVSLPQLAYAWKLGFVLPGNKIAQAQQAHQALCNKLGPARCQLLGLSMGSAEDEQGHATLKLRVASDAAKSFADAAVRSVSDAGGRSVATNMTAEDVSKNIVDAEARIRQRELLVSRLTEILRTRTGKVSELVEAERSVAQAQEELDQARGWLAELRGRVAMSDFEIDYSATAPSTSAGTAASQIGAAIQDSGVTFLIGLRQLLTLLIYLLPWAVIVVPALLLIRRMQRRRTDESDAPARDDA